MVSFTRVSQEPTDRKASVAQRSNPHVNTINQTFVSLKKLFTKVRHLFCLQGVAGDPGVVGLDGSPGKQASLCLT